MAALGITYKKLTHTSDYFPQMLDLAERLIKKGYMYADDTPLEQMREVCLLLKVVWNHVTNANVDL